LTKTVKLIFLFFLWALRSAIGKDCRLSLPSLVDCFTSESAVSLTLSLQSPGIQ
jgi:hypothetical protein